MRCSVLLQGSLIRSPEVSSLLFLLICPALLHSPPLQAPQSTEAGRADFCRACVTRGLLQLLQQPRAVGVDDCPGVWVCTVCCVVVGVYSVLSTGTLPRGARWALQQRTQFRLLAVPLPAAPPHWPLPVFNARLPLHALLPQRRCCWTLGALWRCRTSCSACACRQPPCS